MILHDLYQQIMKLSKFLVRRWNKWRWIIYQPKQCKSVAYRYSDYIPIEASGYVCINAYNRSAIDRNHYYRNDTDIPSILDIDLLTSVANMGLAFAK
jgi:hypothetical protein